MQVRAQILVSKEKSTQTCVTLVIVVDALNDVHESLSIYIETQRVFGRGRDIWQISIIAPNDDALQLIGESERIFVQSGKLKAGNPLTMYSCSIYQASWALSDRNSEAVRVT